METLYKIHGQDMLMFFAIPGGAILLFFLCANCFGILLPVELIAATAILTPLLGALRRLKIWRDRNQYLTPEELASPAAKIFFAAISAWILFSVVGLMIVLGEK